jgi:hypothetical protein
VTGSWQAQAWRAKFLTTTSPSTASNHTEPDVPTPLKRNPRSKVIVRPHGSLSIRKREDDGLGSAGEPKANEQTCNLPSRGHRAWRTTARTVHGIDSDEDAQLERTGAALADRALHDKIIGRSRLKLMGNPMGMMGNVQSTDGDRSTSDLGTLWSGRRDSNPRPSPWQNVKRTVRRVRPVP